MNRYRITLTQVSIADANDEIEARDKVFDTFDKNSLDVDVKLINNTDRVPMTKEEEYRNADVPMPKKKYFYTYEEYSQDTRSFEIESDRQLSKGEITDLACSVDLVDDATYEEDGAVVKFTGTDIGCDIQTEYGGDDTTDE
jgi:hypothetical protein